MKRCAHVKQPPIPALGAEVRHRAPPLPALTSLRFFAAIHVVVYHLSVDHIFSAAPLLGRFVNSGYTGVSLFFVLSGFILAYNYNSVPNPRDFWISRFARIYPVYLAALLFSFAYILAPATLPPTHLWLRLAASATLLQTWYPPFANSFNGPGWTLSVEAFFYALFPFLLPMVRRATNSLFISACAVYAFANLLPALFFQLSHTAYFLNWGTIPPLHLPMFLVGMYLGVTYLNSRQPAFWKPLLIGAATSLILLCLSPSIVFAPFRKALLVLTYATLIYALASVRSGWLTSHWAVLGGEISFSIYILQMPVMRAVLAVTRRLGMGFYLSIAAVLIVLIAVSFLSFRFLELPARLAIRRRLAHTPVALTPI